MKRKAYEKEMSIYDKRIKYLKKVLSVGKENILADNNI